jgi:hypothetical protein
MLLPAFGLFLSLAFFGTVGAVLMRRAEMRPLRASVLAVFVLAAHLGVLAFALAYGGVAAAVEQKPTSPAAIFSFLLGLPLAGVLSGWLAARWFAARTRKR